jgi:hypothetical protein
MNTNDIKIGKEFIEILPNQEYNLAKAYLGFYCPKCLKEKTICLSSVLKNYTNSVGCGCRKKISKPFVKSEPLSETKWKEVFSNIPIKPLNFDDLLGFTIGANKQIPFVCGCGKIFEYSVGKITSGHTKTCGKCNLVNPKKISYNNQILYDGILNEISSTSYKKDDFICGCGNKFKAPYSSVFNGKQKSCGKCKVLSYPSYIGKTFGKLKILEFIGTKARISNQKKTDNFFKCECSCGNIKEITTASIFRNRSFESLSCGKCSNKAKEIRIANPIPDLNDYEGLENWFETQFIKPKFPITEKTINKHKLEFNCKFCGEDFDTSLYDIKRGKILSCGCLSNRISQMNTEVGLFIKELGFEIEYEHYLGNHLHSDIFVKNKNLVIEMNGIYYHRESTKHSELKKFNKAKELGCDFLMFYEDEWRDKKDICKNLIKQKLGINFDVTKLRPKDCEIRIVESPIVKELFEKFHIQGYELSTYNIAVYHKNELIACMAINRPSRQNIKEDYEISRMVCDTRFRINGLWSFLLKYIKRTNLLSGTITTFSENRISNGNVYLSIGMTHCGDVKSDYYWCDNRKRFHKSTMGGKNENLMNKEKGYHKIFDLGKKKFSIEIL